jgi:hypothetical protein
MKEVVYKAVLKGCCLAKTRAKSKKERKRSF